MEVSFFLPIYSLIVGYKVTPHFMSGSTRFDWVRLGSTGFDWVRLGLTVFDWV